MGFDDSGLRVARTRITCRIQGQACGVHQDFGGVGGLALGKFGLGFLLFSWARL